MAVAKSMATLRSRDSAYLRRIRFLLKNWKLLFKLMSWADAPHSILVKSFWTLLFCWTEGKQIGLKNSSSTFDNDSEISSENNNDLADNALLPEREVFLATLYFKVTIKKTLR